MNESELAQFHHTISEQLNSRLSESPKFFGLLVVIATGFAYVLTMPDPDKHVELFVLASALAYIAVLWAIWYLAALGYAFRFLQSIQHSIERKLGWNACTLKSGTPPWPTKRWKDSYWLLPGIYHAHAAGLAVFLVIICAASCFHLWHRLQWPCIILILSVVAAIGGLLWLRWINRRYLENFWDKWKSLAA